MFAMLLGPWPRVTADGVSLAALEREVDSGRADPGDLEVAVERCVVEALDSQAEAGMGLLTDGGVRWADPARAMLDAVRAGDLGSDGMLVRAWHSAASRSGLPVAQAMPGPWTLARLEAGATEASTPEAPGTVADRADELAGALSGELDALARAGCPVVQVMEPAVTGIGADAAARAGFVRAHRRLLERMGDLHAMLAVVGGSAAEAGAEVLFGMPYASYAFDLLAGPDNWYLVREAPADRGIVCAALRAGNGAEDRDQAPQLVWAARYAASSRGRGLERVGLANASPLVGLAPAAARRALDALARSSALAAMPPGRAVEAGLDPRTFSARPGARPPAPASDDR
jgi:hypothetical protein